MPEPDDLPTWATDSTYSTGLDTGLATRLEPTSGEKASGLFRGKRAPARKINWLLGTICDWIYYFATQRNIVVEFTASGTFDPSDYNPGAWVDVYAYPPGGGGGAGQSSAAPGGGGGGGGGNGVPLHFRCQVNDFFGPLTITIGPPGVGGTGGGANDGTSGGNITIADTGAGITWVATGGQGGNHAPINEGGGGGMGFCGGGGGGGITAGVTPYNGGAGGRIQSHIGTASGGTGGGPDGGAGGPSAMGLLATMLQAAYVNSYTYFPCPFVTVAPGAAGTGSGNECGGGGGAAGFLTPTMIAGVREATIQGESGQGYGAGGGGGGGNDAGGSARDGLDGAPGIVLFIIH